MRTLVVTHYFPPEIGAPQARLSELARAWAADGDDVTVLTGMPNHPTGIVPAEYRGAVLRTETVDGYRVVRTWLYATPNEGFVKKTLGHLSFMGSSVLLGWPKIGHPEVVVVSSPTFFSILSAWVLARGTRARLVVEIRDLWPAIFVELGVLTNRSVVRALEAIELASYRAAAAVVVVSEGFRADLVARGVPDGKIETIRNGVDLERFDPSVHDASEVRSTRRSLGVADGDTLVLYIGAHGISHGLTSIVDAAAELRDLPIHVAFVGEGAAKADVVRRVHELGSAKVTTHDGVPRDAVPALLAAADICLVPLRDVPLFSTFIPSKLFEYLGAGKAVIGSVRGEPAQILREAGAVVVEPEDVGAIAAAIRDLADDPDRRARMGEEGRRYVAEHFDRAALARRYRQLLSHVVETDGASPTSPPVASGSTSGSLSTAAQLTRWVWNHPENVRRGRARGVARMAGWQAWERLVKRPLTIHMPGGLRLRVHPHSTAASGVLYCGLPEWEDMRFVLDYLRSGDRFVDVGANVGVFSLLAAAERGVLVSAYEPATATFGRLQENVGLNRLGHRTVLRHAAVGDVDGSALLTVGLDTVNQIVDDETVAARADLEGEAVEMVTLDGDLPSLDDVALVKIDVEGFEPQVLAGASKLLETVRPVLIVEANDRSALRRQLEPLGYVPCRYDPDHRALTPGTWDARRGNNLLLVADLDAARERLARRS